MSDNSLYGFSDDTVFCVMLGHYVVRIFRDWKAANEYADMQRVKELKSGYDAEYMVVDRELT